jgi:hypothetical protein
MRAKIVCLGLILLAGSSSQAAAAGEQIGSAIQVVNLVTAELDRDTRNLQTGDNVRQNENIAVANDALGELKFNDETKLALGPGSRMKLDKFVYDPGKSDGSIVINIVKGTFRFITGVASKPSYVIRIPNASITVRGTIFDGFLQDDGTAWVLLHSGALEVCNNRGRCRVIDEPGKLIRVTDNGDVGIPVKWAGLPGRENVPFDTAFPFVAKAPSIDPNPILTRDGIILGNLPKPEGHEPSDEGGSKDDDHPKQTKKSEGPKPKARSTRTAKRARSDDSNIVGGMDIVIGIGGGFGRHGGHSGHRPGGDMPRGHKY